MEAEEIVFHCSQEGWLVAFFPSLSRYGPILTLSKSSESNLGVKGGISGWGEEDLNFNPSSAISWLADVQGTPTLRQMNAIHDARGLLSFSFPPVEWELAQIAPITNSYALITLGVVLGRFR